MSDTPRTDAEADNADNWHTDWQRECYHTPQRVLEGPPSLVPADFARQLERETATLHAQIARLKQREGELEMLLEGGAGRIARERHRHVTQEGYDAAHDDEHTYGTIRVVAAMLACNGTDASVSDPLDRDDWNLGRHPLERRLEIAGALLAAELDRLARAARWRHWEPESQAKVS